MVTYKSSNVSRILLIVAEVLFISLFSYVVEFYHPIEMARYVSLDVLYCLPVIQTARLTALNTSRRYDTHVSNFVGVFVALVWSATELAITWPYFPIPAFLLNTFTRSIAFTVIIRVVIKLWREREYAHKDMLTGLANRLHLMERLETEQVRSERSGRPYSLLFIDIDDFKRLNDELGHKVGDEALRVLSGILKSCIRKVDVAARLGGDEFVLLLPDTDKQSCYILIKRIESSSRKIFKKNNWDISVSIGQTTHVGRNESIDAVLKLADENMYEIKRAKRPVFRAASPQ